MKCIELTQGKKAFVDDVDYDLVSKKKWYARKYKNTDSFVALLKTQKSNDSKKDARIYRRKQMCEYITGHKCIYKNGNGLDNRRCNIEIK